MIKKLLTIMLLVTTLYVASAAKSSYSVEEVPNLKLQDKNNFISDPAGYLTAAQSQALNVRLLALQDSTTTEMAVVILPGIESDDIFEFAQELATTWGIGKKDNSNGLLLLFDMGEHNVRLQTGYGLEGILTDAMCKRIISDDIIPYMKEDNLYGALDASTARVYTLLTDPAALEEVRSELDAEQAEQDELISNFLNFLVLGSLAVALIIYILTWSKARKPEKYDNYSKSLVWRKSLSWLLLLSVTSLGIGLVFWALALFHYRYRRMRRICCDSCGTKMHRLSETEDNNYLTAAENCEEELQTVDYDVWLCPKCHSIKKFPYLQSQKKYETCPHCGAIAYGLEYVRILRSATTRQSGVGEKIYRCHHCGGSGKRRFEIAKDSGAADLAAGAVLGAAAFGRHSSGGGSSSGGSWGGGSFGGGGASGSW